MNRSFLLGGALGLAVGLLVALFAYQIGRAGGRLRAAEPVIAAPTAAPAPMAPGAAQGGASAEGGLTPELAEHISVLEQLVKTDPKNHDAWVQLGNAYFDSHQHQASVDAYARALQLRPDDPDVLTDQGIMYRALQQYDRALANFQKASRLDPRHLQSLYNQGVVYGFDLHDRAKAEKAWNELIRLAPASDDANRARAALAQLQAGP
jgi:cytochrome c-type biogenesis protein CcmH/NrfG